MKDPVYTFRYILAGDCTVGKTAIARYLTRETFKEEYEITIGVGFYAKIIPLDDGKTVKVMMWDTAGAERFGAYCITPAYFRQGVVVIFVYDMTKRNTFESIPRWIEFANTHTAPQGYKPILIANKTDLSAERVISQEEGLQFAHENNMRYFETSAKTGHNIDGVFSEITEYVNVLFGRGDFKLEEGWNGIEKYEKKVDPFLGRKKNDFCC